LAGLDWYRLRRNDVGAFEVSLRDMGYEHVSSMSAGINGWTAIGGEIE